MLLYEHATLSNSIRNQTIIIVINRQKLVEYEAVLRDSEFDFVYNYIGKCASKNRLQRILSICLTGLNQLIGLIKSI